jgi:hypothetical protein
MEPVARSQTLARPWAAGNAAIDAVSPRNAGRVARRIANVAALALLDR